jgi:hypothetical protein
MSNNVLYQIEIKIRDFEIVPKLLPRSRIDRALKRAKNFLARDRKGQVKDRIVKW